MKPNQKPSSALSTTSSTVIDDFLNLIPDTVEEKHKTGSAKSFTRNRQLPLSKLITFILSMTCSGKTQGVDGKIGKFINQARRSQCWADTETVDRSAVSKARAKLSHTLFESLLADAVDLAYNLWPESSEYT